MNITTYFWYKNSLGAQGTSVLKGLHIIVKNQFLYGESQWFFLLQNPAIALCLSWSAKILAMPYTSTINNAAPSKSFS